MCNVNRACLASSGVSMRLDLFSGVLIRVLRLTGISKPGAEVSSTLC